MSFIFVFYLEGQNEKQHEHFFSASSSWIRVQLGGDWIGLHNTRLGYTDSTLWWFTQNLTLRWVTLYFTAVGPFDRKQWDRVSCIFHSQDQSVDFGGTSNRKNLKISVFGCFRVNLLEFGFRKYDLRKFGKLCNLLFLFL